MANIRGGAGSEGSNLGIDFEESAFPLEEIGCML